MSRSPARRRASARALLFGVGLAGCELVVGDIELPPNQVAPTDDAQVADAADDVGVSPDTGPQPDGADTDAAPPTPDAVPPPTDALPDLDQGLQPDATVPPDAAPPPPDLALPPDAAPGPLAAYAGRWHMYGLRTRVNDGGTAVVQGVLVVGQNTVDVANFNGQVLRENIVVGYDPERPSRLRLEPAPVSGPITGVVDLDRGAGVFTNNANNPQATLVVLVRESEARPDFPSAYRFIRAGVQAGDVELGNATFDGVAAVTEDPRVAAGIGNLLDPRVNELRQGEPLRHILWWQTGEARALQRVLTTTPDGQGLVGTSLDEEGRPDALYVGEAATPPQGLPDAGEFFCGAVTRDAVGAMLSTTALARVASGGSIEWPELGYGGGLRISDDGAGLLVDGTSLLGTSQTPVSVDREGNWLAFPAVDGSTAEVQWGVGFCVRSSREL